MENTQHVKEFSENVETQVLWFERTCPGCWCGGLITHVIGTLKPTCFAQMS